MAKGIGMDFSRLQQTSKIVDEWKYPQPPANRSGHVQVDGCHRLYWEDYGDPAGEPVMFLHGGPGGGTAPVMARYFDPARYRVILFDQRGCGKSEPNVAVDATAALADNTTDHLVADIETLRDALGITAKMHVFGGSWGSTLAMAYAVEHPDHCASLILRGIFLGEPEDLAFMYQGNAESFAEAPFALTRPGAYVSYPEAWAGFVAQIPPAERGDMMKAYKAIFDLAPANAADRQRQLDAAVAWSIWEGTISNAIPETQSETKFGEADFALCFAQIEAHYFANDLFMPRDHLIANAAVLARLPVYIVHGRFDLVCPLTQASRLVEALRAAGGDAQAYVIVNAGHSAMEREIALALTAIMDGLPRL